MNLSDTLKAALATATAVGVTVCVRDDEVRVRGNVGALPPDVRAHLRAERESIRRLLAPCPVSARTSDPTDADIGAVRLTSPLIGDYWLIADDDEMTPDIADAGLPVFRFAEVPFLRGLSPDDLKAVAAVKRVFPTSQVLQ